jgi:hypothetical protein
LVSELFEQKKSKHDDTEPDESKSFPVPSIEHPNEAGDQESKLLDMLREIAQFKTKLGR